MPRRYSQTKTFFPGPRDSDLDVRHYSYVPEITNVFSKLGTEQKLCNFRAVPLLSPNLWEATTKRILTLKSIFDIYF